MGIQGIDQPTVIQIDESLRLRKYDGVYDFALAWHQDDETVYLVDGKRDPYTIERLGGMYRYLNNVGELYFVEVLDNGTYKPIGDVTFWQEDMPIVIGEPAFRGKGIGRKVTSPIGLYVPFSKTSMKYSSPASFKYRYIPASRSGV